jgi:2-oxoisovalerate dehydrogenase E2 component (dihydrolipoyl transacylase)
VTTFHLPDLGEGLAEAEIVTWHIKEGDDIKVDQPLLSVETAKAVVEVPSPVTGKVIKLHGKAGDMIEVGKPLVDFKTAEGHSIPAPTEHASPTTGDKGTVVGVMPVSDREWVEHRVELGASGAIGAQRQIQRVRAAPSIRMLAKRLDVNLATLKGTGRNGLITIDDVLNSSDFKRNGRPAYRMPALSERLAGEFEPLRGPRRAMAHTMSVSRDEIAMVTVFDDADLHAWPKGTDITSRAIRAIVAGVKAVPTLNAIFDPNGPSRRLLQHVHVGIAVDIDDKLLVPVIRDADKLNLIELRKEIQRLKDAVRTRSLAPEELRDYTITLSNFGTLAGHYATPLVVPPTVAILGAGKIRREVIATDDDKIEIHRRMPLSLTFDHRSITGGEACRFLAVVIADLQQAD